MMQRIFGAKPAAITTPTAIADAKKGISCTMFPLAPVVVAAQAKVDAAQAKAVSANETMLAAQAKVDAAHAKVVVAQGKLAFLKASDADRQSRRDANVELGRATEKHTIAQQKFERAREEHKIAKEEFGRALAEQRSPAPPSSGVILHPSHAFFVKGQAVKPSAPADVVVVNLDDDLSAPAPAASAAPPPAKGWVDWMLRR